MLIQYAGKSSELIFFAFTDLLQDLLVYRKAPSYEQVLFSSFMKMCIALRQKVNSLPKPMFVQRVVSRECSGVWP